MSPWYLQTRFKHRIEAWCISVCVSVRPSVLLKVKVLAKVVFDEVQSTWNLVHMFPTDYDLSNVNAKLRVFFTPISSPLNIENDSMRRPSVYLEMFLFKF